MLRARGRSSRRSGGGAEGIGRSPATCRPDAGGDGRRGRLCGRCRFAKHQRPSSHPPAHRRSPDPSLPCRPWALLPGLRRRTRADSLLVSAVAALPLPRRSATIIAARQVEAARFSTYRPVSDGPSAGGGSPLRWEDAERRRFFPVAPATSGSSCVSRIGAHGPILKQRRPLLERALEPSRKL